MSFYQLSWSPGQGSLGPLLDLRQPSSGEVEGVRCTNTSQWCRNRVLYKNFTLSWKSMAFILQSCWFWKFISLFTIAVVSLFQFHVRQCKILGRSWLQPGLVRGSPKSDAMTTVNHCHSQTCIDRLRSQYVSSKAISRRQRASASSHKMLLSYILYFFM